MIYTIIIIHIYIERERESDLYVVVILVRSVPAEGPAYGLDIARRGEFPLRAPRARKRPYIYIYIYMHVDDVIIACTYLSNST